VTDPRDDRDGVVGKRRTGLVVGMVSGWITAIAIVARV